MNINGLDFGNASAKIKVCPADETKAKGYAPALPEAPC